MTDETIEVVIDEDDKTGSAAAAAKKPVDTKPDDVVVERTEDKPPERKVVTPEEGIQALQDKLDQERNARIEAERRARTSDARATQATQEAQDTNLQFVTGAIETVRQSQEALKAKYREARTNNDFDAEIEAQREIAKNEARLVQLEAGKQALEKKPKEQPRETTTDPVEQFVSRLSPRSAAWVRQHPEFVRDERQYNRMIGAHNLAVGDGLTPDSDEYFTALETSLKLRTEGEAERREEQQQPARRAAPAAAPPSRTSGSQSSRQNVVRLTKDEREMASMMGMSDQEYARNKLALEKEGKLGRAQ